MTKKEIDDLRQEQLNYMEQKTNCTVCKYSQYRDIDYYCNNRFTDNYKKAVKSKFLCNAFEGKYKDEKAI